MTSIFRMLVILCLTGVVVTIPTSCTNHISDPAVIKSSDNLVQVVLLAGQSNMAGAGDFDKLSAHSKAKLAAIGNRILISVNGATTSPVQYTNSQHKLEKYGFLKSFGPEVSLALTLGERYPDREFLLIKTTRGGTSLYGAWNPDWTREKAQQVEATIEKQTTAYFSLHLQHMRDALAHLEQQKKRYEIAGVLWLQGENDAAKEVSALSYEANLKNLIARYREATMLPNLPFVAGQINSTYGRFKPGPDMVRQAIVSVALADENVYVIRTKTDRDWADFPKHPDNVHYNTAGQLKWGRVYADALDVLGAF